MSFEWDKKKGAANRKKHGIAFDAVPSSFDGPMLVAEDTASLATSASALSEIPSW